MLLVDVSKYGQKVWVNIEFKNHLWLTGYLVRAMSALHVDSKHAALMLGELQTCSLGFACLNNAAFLNKRLKDIRCMILNGQGKS